MPSQESSRPVVLVTGASRGIGRAIAELLARRGCRVAVHCRTTLALAEDLAASLPGSGHRAFAADLASSAETERLWRAVTTAMGPVAVLVNNAGMFEDHPLWATDFDQWQQAWRHTLDTNLVAPANLCHLAGNAMIAAGGGRIVNISSRGAFRGEPVSPAYAASKAGLNAMTQSLALALASRKVYCFVVAPGYVETDMAAEALTGPRGPGILAQYPMGRVAQPDEVAAVAVFCALDAPAAMTGSILDVNGASYLRT
ncbi:MAG: SDR family oxidoreductase [Holophaga sp.]|jgi:NAD(P)-dependent dehydrogenase (short-subunit alcohol dehydrogenase family)